MSEREPNERTEDAIDRRRLLGAGGVIAGLAAAKVLGGAQPAAAQEGEPVLLGRTNLSARPTGFATEPGVTLVEIGGVVSMRVSGGKEHPSQVVFGPKRSGNPATDAPVIATGHDASGLLGTSGNAQVPAVQAGVVGAGPIGVAGSSGDAAPAGGVTVTAGVYGASGHGFGVMGSAGGIANVPVTGTAGVFGIAAGVGVVGVQAANVGGGIALDVIGRARFSSVGKASVPAGSLDVFVEHPEITADSAVIVTLVDDPGAVSVRWTEVLAGAGFRVHVKPRPSRAITFCYLVVEGSPAAADRP